MENRKFSAVILFVLFALVTLVSCNTVTNTPKGRVPVYQGMTISSLAKSSSYTSTTVPFAAGGEEGDSGNHNGWYKDKENVDQDEPFGDNSESIEEVIDSSLKVTGSAESIYYASPNDDVLITVHIDNPDSFEIMSFTLNKTKYSSYMFEYGSDMENLILKINVGITSGIIDYTIDEIKYIDGTEIKDVIINGDQTISVGVYTNNQLSAQTSETIGFNDIKLDITINDNDGLIKYSGGKLMAILYDGDSLLEQKELQVGENTITFDGLEMGQIYQYAIVGYYDNLKTGFGMNLLYKKAFSTKNVLAFTNIKITQTSIEFDLLWHEDAKNYELTELVLLKNGQETKLNIKDTSVTNLLSNNDYTLVVRYKNNEKEEELKLDFHTASKLVPVITITTDKVTRTSFDFDLDIIDVDNLVNILKIELLDESSILYTTEDPSIRSFTNLNAYTLYTIKVTYEYNLNDGNGDTIEEVTKSLYTTPILEAIETECINTAAVVEGDSIILQMKINNPSDVIATEVKVNGVWYKVNGATTTSNIRVEIQSNGQFAGGETTFIIEEIRGSVGNNSFTFVIDENNTATCFISGEINLLGICIVDEDGNERDYAFQNETMYFKVIFSNPTGYTITSLNLDFDYDKMIVVDINTVLVRIRSINSFYSLRSYSYSANDNTKTKIEIVKISNFVWLDSVAGDIVEIKTAEDLKNMNENKYYKLMNDIDLKDIPWNSPGKFNGYFDGNGYAIKNMRVVETFENKSVYLGLFSLGSGIVCNLNIEDILIIVTINNGRFYFGGITPMVDDGIKVTNVHTSGVVSATATISCLVGGIVGSSYCDLTVTIENCLNEINLAMTTTQLLSEVGGIIGHIDESTNIINCHNTGDISNSGASSTLYSGGIVGNSYGPLSVVDCHNKGNIIGKSDCSSVYSGGIVGNSDATLFIMNCYNTGDITGISDRLSVYSGGIVGKIEEETTITNCYNTGNITSTSPYEAYFGEIVGYNDYNKLYLIACFYVAKETVMNFVGGGNNSSIKDCYHNSNGSQGIKVASFEELIEKMKNLWNLAIWNFDVTTDLGFPTLK